MELIAVNITREIYPEELKALEAEAIREDRSPTKTATMLIMEAINHREAQRTQQDQLGGNKS